jgi:hypothetical protein
MRRIAVFIACVVLIVFALADQASARRGWGFHGGGFRGRGFRGGGLRGFRGGVWRGGRGFAWRGGRGWRGRGRGWGFWPWGIAAGLAAAPYYYRSYYSDCPLVRQRVVTRYGYRTRWVRACNTYPYW